MKPVLSEIDPDDWAVASCALLSQMPGAIVREEGQTIPLRRRVDRSPGPWSLEAPSAEAAMPVHATSPTTIKFPRFYYTL